MVPHPTVFLITKNLGKIKSAKSVFDQFSIDLQQISQDFPEIQADSSLEIARHTAIQAANQLKLPVIREDHSLFIHSLGIPGPYTSYIEKKIPPQRLLQLLEVQKDRTGHFEIATVYVGADGTVKEFVYQVPVYFKTQEVVRDERGGWNGLICLKGKKKAFTEYSEEDRLEVWSRNYHEIAKCILGINQ